MTDVVIEAAKGEIERLRNELTYVRDMARAYQETAVERARELAETRGLLEACLSTGCLMELTTDVRAYLDRTRPAAECDCIDYGGTRHEPDCAAPAQAPSVLDDVPRHYWCEPCNKYHGEEYDCPAPPTPAQAPSGPAGYRYGHRLDCPPAPQPCICAPTPAPRGNEWCVGCWSNVGIGVEHKSWCRYCPARRGAP